MYSFRKNFEDRREEAVKKITGYEELIAFFQRSLNLSEYSQHSSHFIGQSKIKLIITQKSDERSKAEWKNRHENDEIITNSEDFSNECEVEYFKRIIIYILRRDNLDFKIVRDSVNSYGSTFIVDFIV